MKRHRFCMHCVPFIFHLLFTRISPVGICSLIAAKLAGMGHIGQAFEMLGYVMGTAIAGLFIHGVIVLPLVYFVFTRKNPIIYIKNLSDAIATAYGTDSRLVKKETLLSFGIVCALPLSTA